MTDFVVVTLWRWFVGVCALAIAGYFAAPGELAQAIVNHAIGFGCAAAIVVGTRRNQPRRPGAWYLIAAGLALWTLGDVLWSVLELGLHIDPWPSVADVAYLAAYPALVLGVTWLVRDRVGGRDLSTVLDAVAVTIAVGLPSWVFLMAPAASDTSSSLLGRLVAVAYPLADLLVLLVLLRLVLSPGRHGTAYVLLALGIVVTLVADTIFAVPAVADTYASGDPLDLLYLAAYVFLGAAALHPSMGSVGQAARRDSELPPWWRVAMVGLAGLGAPALLLGEALDGHVQHIPLILGAWCLVLAVVLVRLWSLLRQLSSAAERDPLTGLPNRTLLLDRVEARLRGSSTDEVALFYLDLDGFKEVNDTAGHAAGDELLIDLAERLREAVRPGDLVARLGGDEFVVLCDDVHDDETAQSVAERLSLALAAPFWVAGDPTFLSVSIGVSRARGTDAAALLRDADAAMYRAKASTKAMAASDRFERDLALAVEREELALHYQPVLHLESGRVSGVEATLRWEHPEWGDTRPPTILPIAEASGLIVPIGRWVLAQACSQLRAWRDQYGLNAPDEVRVNVSVRELLDPTYVEHVAHCLRISGLAPGALVLEVPDEALADVSRTALDTLGRLRRYGVHICLDHFGDGRRSLNNVRRVPIDRLKLGPALVTAIAEDAEDRIVAQSMLQLGTALGMEVTAAGVETPEQRQQLEALGCTHAQGNLWSPPLPPGSVLDAALGCLS